MANVEKYETAVAKVRSLFERWFDAGVDLFVELFKVEHSGVWRNPENATFGDFLAREFPNHAISLDRYYHVTQAIQIHGEARVRQVGVEACHALIAPKVISDENTRALVTASIDRYMAEHQCAPPPAEVRRIVNGVVGAQAPMASSTKRVMRESQLELENRQLKAELVDARRRIRELESELKKLRPRRASSTAARA